MHSLVDRRRLAGVVERWQGVRVVVIGDALLDEWCHGDSDRLSREAPIPVVSVRRTRVDPGGAGNTAVNLATLGARPVLVAPVGGDAAGARLRERLAAAGVDVRAVVVPGWRTPAKRRVVAGDQLVVRLEEGQRGELPEPSIRDLTEAAATALAAEPAAVVLCDYGYGALGSALVRWLREHRDRLPLLAVDAHDPARWRSLRPTLVTPSFAEAARAAGFATRDGGTPDRASLVESSATHVLDGTGAEVAAVTLDADGAVVVGRGAPPVRTTGGRAAPDGHAVGAGDAYAAALVLATAAGAGGADAAWLAQLAATAAVTGSRTCVCRRERLLAELRAAPSLPDGAVPDLDRFVARVRAERARGARLVFTNGCFDILHRGHVQFLAQARALGDLLVVAVNSDASVTRLKGPGRPVNHVEDRVAILASLSYVDQVVVFDEDSPVRLLEDLRPEIYVKGGDYRADLLPEAALVRRLGGRIRILDYVPDRSTSAVIERIRAYPRIGSYPRRAGTAAPVPGDRR